MTFVGGGLQRGQLLAAGYAYEQATNVRLAPSWTNPSMFRCVPGSTFFSPHHCHPGDLLGAAAFGPTETPGGRRRRGHGAGDAVAGAGRAAATFGAFTPGVAKDYTASTTANVISTAGDAALTVVRSPGT